MAKVKGLYHYRNRQPLIVRLHDGMAFVCHRESVFLGYDPSRYTKPVKEWSAIVVNNNAPNGLAVILSVENLQALTLDVIG